MKCFRFGIDEVVFVVFFICWSLELYDSCLVFLNDFLFFILGNRVEKKFVFMKIVCVFWKVWWSDVLLFRLVWIILMLEVCKIWVFLDDGLCVMVWICYWGRVLNVLMIEFFWLLVVLIMMMSFVNVIVWGCIGNVVVR